MARRKIVITAKGAPRNNVTSLTPIANQERIRRAFLNKYRQRVKRLQVDSDRLRHYHEVDVPAFIQWRDLEFGPLRLQLSELLREIGPLSHLVCLINDYAAALNVTDYKAYRDVMKAKAQDRLEDIEQAIEDEARAWEQEEGATDEDDVSREAQEDFFHFTQGASERPHPPPAPLTATLQALYRQLVRKLHPDYLKNPSTEQTALWHEVQNAYAWEDLERLEAIYKQLDHTAPPSISYETMPLSDILNLQCGVENRLEAVRAEINKVKKNGDWNFTAVKADPKKLRRLVRDLHYTYEVEIAEAQKSLRFFKERLAQLGKNPRDKIRAHNKAQGSPR
jgi:hypothetical protein